MALILNIETTTTQCSVSLSKDGEVLAYREENSEYYSHSEKLHVFIKETLQEAGVAFSTIEAVAVSQGPGSYTGLRIGVSAAKGLCFALDIPLIAVETLRLLAIQSHIPKGYIVPMLDARRMEVYAAIFDERYEQIRATQAEIITENSFQAYLKTGKVYFTGPGAAKCSPLLTHPNAVFPQPVTHPSAREMATLSEARFQAGGFENAAYFEPCYLKDFIAGFVS